MWLILRSQMNPLGYFEFWMRRKITTCSIVELYWTSSEYNLFRRTFQLPFSKVWWEFLQFILGCFVKLLSTTILMDWSLNLNLNSFEIGFPFLFLSNRVFWLCPCMGGSWYFRLDTEQMTGQGVNAFQVSKVMGGGHSSVQSKDRMPWTSSKILFRDGALAETRRQV